MDRSFEIVHVILYSNGRGSGFRYLIIESLQSKKQYAILDSVYRGGIKFGYMKSGE